VSSGCNETASVTDVADRYLSLLIVTYRYSRCVHREQRLQLAVKTKEKGNAAFKAGVRQKSPKTARRALKKHQKSPETAKRAV